MERTLRQTSMSSEKRSCAACEFALANPRARNKTGAIDMGVPQSFQCRRFPPTFSGAVANGMPIAMWPNLVAEHWCGEFKPSGPSIAESVS